MWDYTGENPLLDARGYEVTGERERPTAQDNRALNKVLPNGGRLYVDGAHPEYSTPETTNARDLVLFEKAGERLADACREAANRNAPAAASSSSCTRTTATARGTATATTRTTWWPGACPSSGWWRD